MNIPPSEISYQVINFLFEEGRNIFVLSMCIVIYLGIPHGSIIFFLLIIFIIRYNVNFFYYLYFHYLRKMVNRFADNVCWSFMGFVYHSGIYPSYDGTLSYAAHYQNQYKTRTLVCLLWHLVPLIRCTYTLMLWDIAWAIF